MFKPNRVFQKKKKMHKKGPTVNKQHSKKRTKKKNVVRHENNTKKEKSKKDEHAKTNKYEKVPNNKGNEQVFIWRSV